MRPAINAMEKLVEKNLGAQKRKDGSSNALHAKRVRTTLMSALVLTGEMPRKTKCAVIDCAALGHDLLEDSPIKIQEIEKRFGKEVLVMIQELTNTEGDSHTKGYVLQMVKASEEARLIKYADLCDNILHVSYGLHTLGEKWTRNYFLPIVDPMRKALEKTAFKKYPKSAALLRQMSAFARLHMAESLRQLK